MSTIHNETYFTQVKIMPRSRNYQERSVPKFLKKVFSILEENTFNEYISWSDDGKALIIKKPTDFAAEVLPLFFKHSNFSSFIRQLNMYKFKKSKSCVFDHIYTHPMFQCGRVDLLRNIQRKTAENEVPMDSQSLPAEEDLDVENLIEENMRYKKLHKDLTAQVEFIQKKMIDIKSEVSQLYSEQQKTASNETFLKNILKKLTKAYGFETIAKIIENDAEENSEFSEFPSMMLQEAGLQEESCENSSVVSNENVSQTPGSNSEDDGFLERFSQFSPESQSEEHFSTKDTPQVIEDCHPRCGKDDSLERLPLFSLDFGFNVNFHDEECEAVVSPKLTKIDSYVIWVDELKHREYNSEMLFGQAVKRFNGNLNIEDF